jgi:hypothetical protein
LEIKWDYFLHISVRKMVATGFFADNILDISNDSTITATVTGIQMKTAKTSGFRNSCKIS